MSSLSNMPDNIILPLPPQDEKLGTVPKKQLDRLFEHCIICHTSEPVGLTCETHLWVIESLVSPLRMEHHFTVLINELNHDPGIVNHLLTREISHQKIAALSTYLTTTDHYRRFNNEELSNLIAKVSYEDELEEGYTCPCELNGAILTLKNQLPRIQGMYKNTNVQQLEDLLTQRQEELHAIALTDLTQANCYSVPKLTAQLKDLLEERKKKLLESRSRWFKHEYLM